MQTYGESAARTLALDVVGRRSIEVQETDEVHINMGAIPPGSLPGDPSARPQGNITNEMRRRYLEDEAGHRLLELESRTAGKLTARWVYAFDGSATTSIAYGPDDFDKQQVVRVDRHFLNEDGNNNREMPASLKYLYVGRKPLYEALAEAKDLGPAEVLGRPCHKLLFPGVQRMTTLDEVYYLDDATAIPLKVDVYRNPEALEKDRKFGSWTAEKIEIVDGHAITPISSTVSYNNDGAVMVTWKHRIDSIRFNGEIPASTFKPALDPGVTILNSVTKRYSQAPGAKSKVATMPTATVAPTGPPPTAEPPADHTAAWTAASIFTGCTLLAAAAIAAWRGRMPRRNQS